MFGTLIKSTGLYFNKQSKGLCYWCAVIRIALLCLAVFVRTIDFVSQNVSGPFNLFTSQQLGWTFQSVMAIGFVIYWQMNGSIRKIEDGVLMSKDKLGGNYGLLKRWIYFFPGIIALSLAVPCVFVGWKANKAMHELWGHDNVKLVYVLVVKTGFILYGVFIGHVPLYIFMITVWSLNVEFQESNRRFKEFFKSVKSPADDQMNIERFRMFCETHYLLVKKLQRANKIFKLFTFLMIAVWLPTTIFAPVALLRTEISFQIIFRVYDFARSILHFYGLCVLPAEVYTQSQKTTIILNNEICMRVGSSHHSQNLIPILKTFAESIVQTHSGITVGGMVIIRKSTVLTCLSILVPYVVLFLQLHIGTTQ